MAQQKPGSSAFWRLDDFRRVNLGAENNIQATIGYEIKGEQGEATIDCLGDLMLHVIGEEQDKLLLQITRGAFMLGSLQVNDENVGRTSIVTNGARFVVNKDSISEAPFELKLVAIVSHEQLTTIHGPAAVSEHHFHAPVERFIGKIPKDEKSSAYINFRDNQVNANLVLSHAVGSGGLIKSINIPLSQATIYNLTNTHAHPSNFSF